MKRWVACLLSFVLVVSACSASSPSVAPTSPAGVELVQAALARATVDEAEATRAAEAINAFAADLHRKLGETPGNLVFSPSSIALALAMARAGARGETADEMDRVLHDLGADDHAAAANALDAALNGRSGTFKDRSGKSVDVALRIANTAFGQRGMVIEQPFLDALATRYGAGLHVVDYRADPEAARQAINAWVDDRTEHRIQDLLARGVIETTTRLTLVNAIYLKAPWAAAFTEGATQPGPFVRADGSTVEAQLMRLSASLPYAEGPGWRAVELPYAGGSLAMTVIVPDDLAAFEAALDAERLADVVRPLVPQSVNLTFPRFGFETKAGLAETLAELGMPRAFEPDAADFSGITREEKLFISAVVHQANIDVDEKGTEAAAATAVVVGVTSAPSNEVVLRVDRPFLFLLRDVPTGAVVFMGRVVDPSAS